MLVDARGMPRYWATIWASVDGTILAPSTLQRQLSAIEKLYAAIENRSGRDCLDDLLTRIDLDELEPLLEGYFVELRNRSFDEGLNGTESWQVAIKFIRDTLDRISCAGTAPAIDRISARLQRLDALYAQIKPVRVKTTKTLRALPAGVLEDLQEIMEPGSDRNPFKSVDNAVRNYALFHLLLHQGLRRGEAAMLTVDAIKEGLDPRTGERRFWIDITENEYEDVDPRQNLPSLKTPSSTRQIPISCDLVDVIQGYTENYRGKQNHSFMFSSQMNLPLSLPMINSFFATISESLSDTARKELWQRRRKKTVTPHDLRHTAAVVRLSEFLDAGVEMDLALSKLRTFFGWKEDSEMPSHYARATFEHRLAIVWNSRFDVHVEHLRTLEAVVEP